MAQTDLTYRKHRLVVTPDGNAWRVYSPGERVGWPIRFTTLKQAKSSVDYHIQKMRIDA